MNKPKRLYHLSALNALYRERSRLRTLAANRIEYLHKLRRKGNLRNAQKFINAIKIIYQDIRALQSVIDNEIIRDLNKEFVK